MAKELFTKDMLSQLDMVFDKMQNKMCLKLYLDKQDISEELKEYATQLCDLTDKLRMEIAEDETVETPCVRICDDKGNWKGMAFHGVPGGHEFTPFILGLYNASGPGQSVGDRIRSKIEAIDKPVHMKAIVSLSCTVCPELVSSAQRIASLNDNVTVDVYDMACFEEFKYQYNIQRVPCLILNDGEPSFGKKNIGQILDLIKKC